MLKLTLAPHTPQVADMELWDVLFYLLGLGLTFVDSFLNIIPFFPFGMEIFTL